MNLRIILENELNGEELNKLEILFGETHRDILDSFLILTDSPELCRICRKFDIAVAAVLSGGEKEFPGIPYAVTDVEELDERYLDRVWRRFRGLPWDICETERCLIRETTVEDVDAFYRIYADRSITEYMDALFEDPEEERQYTKDYIEKVYGFYGFGMWTVCLKGTGEVIGRAGFSMRAGFEEPELGYVIGCPWQRQGIATEICRAILEYGREELGFESIRILMKPENIASERLGRKLGFCYVEEIDLDKNGKEKYSLWRWKAPTIDKK